MTITAEQVDLLNNRFGALAHKVQLGTLIQNAESVSAAEISLAEGKVLVGDASGLATATTMASGTILVGSAASKAVAVAVSGDATLAATGALTIASLAVSGAKLAADAVSGADKIADDAVSLEHLDPGITPGLMVMAAGIFTTLGGDANESITVAGAVGTDTALVWVQKNGGTPRTVDTITPGTGAIAVVMSGDPSTDHKLAYIVYRAPA